MSVRIAVPATSANLGPGFDVLGLALSLHNVFEFDAQAEGLSITGCDPAYAGEDNLAVAAWRAVERRAGAKPSGIRLHIETNVPVARGLGSSATLLAAGALAANYFLGAPLGQDEILSILTELEGHPDNVAPALRGGLRGSMAVDGRVLCAEYPVHPGFGFCALIPNFETSTRDARRVLPGQVPFSDATANLARLALTLRALETGDAEMLGAAMDDRLHQPYRKQLIHEYDRVRALALANGAAAFCISGSGSTLLSIVRAEEAETFAERMESALADSFYGWRALALHPDFEGARILEK